MTNDNQHQHHAAISHSMKRAYTPPPRMMMNKERVQETLLSMSLGPSITFFFIYFSIVVRIVFFFLNPYPYPRLNPWIPVPMMHGYRYSWVQVRVA